VLYGLGPLSVSVVMVSYFNSHQLRFYSNRIRFASRCHVIRGSAIPIMLRMLVTVALLSLDSISWSFYHFSRTNFLILQFGIERASIEIFMMFVRFCEKKTFKANKNVN